MARIDRDARRLHPRLRALRNGDDEVNQNRALRSNVVVSVLRSASDGVRVADSPDPVAPPKRRRDKERLPRRRKLNDENRAANAFVNVYIHLRAEAGEESRGEIPTVNAMETLIREMQPLDAPQAPPTIVTSRRNMVLATVPIAMLADLEKIPEVALIQPAEPLRFDRPRRERQLSARAPVARNVRSNKAAHGDGQGVLIGIIDVGGFDFAHPDFRSAKGGTRFLRIWDQGGKFRGPPARFDYGSEFTQEQLDAAIDDEYNIGLPATRLEEQSQREVGSHATHVASIAAGRRGVCPKAKIAGVLISMPSSGDTLQERRQTFSDTSRIVHAIEYLVDLARAEKLPLSINISLGTNGGAHDGSSGVGRWMDALCSAPGIAISLASGNAGQIEPTAPGDLGWLMGRIHAMGTIPSKGLQTDLEWVVQGDGIVDVSENELEIWYGAQDRVNVLLNPPGTTQWIKVRPGEFIENQRLANGTFVSIYNELYHAANGCNTIAVYLSPDMKSDPLVGIASGVWRVRLEGADIRHGHFHAWIERDDPVELEAAADGRMYFFPSYFSRRTATASHTISSLACANHVIAVANLDEARELMHVSSSPGPTRDGRMKPDIAAPGTAILAAKGFAGPTDRWTSMTGTSMASPYVAGVIGLMLGTNPQLTSAQCLGILQRTARPLPGASYAWQKDAGFGQIDPCAAVREAATFEDRIDLGRIRQGAP